MQTITGQREVVKSLEIRLPTKELEDAVVLLQGIAPVDAEIEQTSLWLVSMLESDRAAIRQLAIMNLSAITSETLAFHPDADPGRRREAIRRWEKFLKRNENRLVTPR